MKNTLVAADHVRKTCFFKKHVFSAIRNLRIAKNDEMKKVVKNGQNPCIAIRGFCRKRVFCDLRAPDLRLAKNSRVRLAFAKRFFMMKNVFYEKMKLLCISY
jgi:hypothetical protein